MELYLLADKHGTLVDTTTGKAKEVWEFMLIQTPGMQRIAAFISPIDAEICKKYLNRQTHGTKNEYEIVRHTAPQVKSFFKEMPLPVSLVMGICIDDRGQLVITNGCYSLAHLTLNPMDIGWLFLDRPQPQRTVFDSLRAQFQRWHATEYLDELTDATLLDQQQLAKTAAVALAAIGARTGTKESGVVVFSCKQKAWRRLQ